MKIEENILMLIYQFIILKTCNLLNLLSRKTCNLLSRKMETLLKNGPESNEIVN